MGTRPSINVQLPMPQALVLTRDILQENNFHIVGECDLKSTLKNSWDEDIRPTTILATIHLPSVLSLSSHKKRTHNVSACTPTAVISATKQPGITRISILNPGGSKEFGGDDEVGAVVSAVKRAIKATLKKLEVGNSITLPQ